MSTNKRPSIDKGALAEEALRFYFSDLGFYVVRGVPVRHQNIDVTDVDLWLYARPNSISRERINVDLKNKKSAEALGRIFWTKGLQAALGLESCIVATSNKKENVKSFGKKYGVKVLNGEFLSALIEGYKTKTDRLYQEEFTKNVISKTKSKKREQWAIREQSAKERLLSHLNFDGCNAWLDDCGYFIDQSSVLTPG